MVMTEDRCCFVDTNVLLASTDVSRLRHSEALAFLESGMDGTQRLFASGQVYREYLVVATRPVEVNGLGLATGSALANLSEFRRCIQMLDENADVADRLSSMVKSYRLKGKRIHDANLVATMRAHGLVRLRTDNPDDFSVFEEIEVES